MSFYTTPEVFNLQTFLDACALAGLRLEFNNADGAHGCVTLQGRNLCVCLEIPVEGSQAIVEAALTAQGWTA